jgi:hypothetical protein
MVGLAARPERCTGKLFLTWGIYGAAAALLWRALAGQPWGAALAWILALAAGALLFAMGEV